MSDQPLIVCVDVDYRETCALAAAVWFRGWSASESEGEATATIHEIAPYEPGEFYRRELPCLLNVISRGPSPDRIIVDGYVWLDTDRPGLGAHLHSALAGSIPVIGVAKTRFVSATCAIPVTRGESQSPLFVTAAGVDVNDAAEWVKSMHGPFRLPTMLKRVDHLARNGHLAK